jgi:hypothetical protein
LPLWRAYVYGYPPNVGRQCHVRTFLCSSLNHMRMDQKPCSKGLCCHRCSVLTHNCTPSW